MPTVILLDVSLSMARPIIGQESVEYITRHQLAVYGINAFLENLAAYSKLEFISLVAFSSLYEIICGFTRDYEQIKNKIQIIEEFDKTCIEAAFHAVNTLVLEEWGNSVPCQVILVTDGCVGIGPMSIKNTLLTMNKRDGNGSLMLPFHFPGQLHVMCLASNEELMATNARMYYQKLIDLTGNGGNIYVPENNVSANTVKTIFQKLADEIYSFKGVLKCGNLNSNIILSPPPMPYTKQTDFEARKIFISKTIDVCGFIPASDVNSPMAISRHLILPISGTSKDGNFPENQLPNLGIKEAVECQSEGEDGNNDEGKVPSFCVLLHGALKVENMVAVVMLGDDWFGYIYSHADCKKKSNLMLTVLPSGSDSVPWLGDLNNLGCRDFLEAGETVPAFPVRPNDKRSYAQNCVVWIKQVGLQSDIQKILRHARKLPEKTQQFYKELNRLRRAAISLGFIELLDGLAFIFERECSLLPGNAHPDCALQLTHATNELRKPHNRDIKFAITPLLTKFNTNSSGKAF